MSERKKILIIEDEKHIAEGLKLNLSLKGHDVAVANDGLKGLSQWKSFGPDLIVLDIMMPGMDGLSVLENIRREDDQLPILILSAKGETKDKVKALKGGVDDYMAKPFNLDEFLLRIERLLKRSGWGRTNAEDPDLMEEFPHENFTFGKNTIDFVRCKAHTVEGTIDLTGQELKILKLFVLNIGKPLSRKKLLQVGWGYTEEISTRTVDNFLVRFRKYFEENPKDPVYFKSLRSIGYVFDPHPQSDGATR